MFLRLIVACFIAAVFCAASTRAQAATDRAQSSESLLLSPGDLVRVAVFDVPELEQHLRVTDAGSITMPLIGTIAVAGMTPDQAEQAVNGALISKGFMRHPQSIVSVEQYAAAAISVSGQVEHPGSYQVTTPRDLMDVLAMAGGLTPVASTRVTIQRRGVQGQVLHADVVNDANAALHNSLLVYPGDLVVVPKAGIVYVLGDVSRPGGYAMVNDSELTLMQAIALASGSTKTAGEAHVRLLRQTVNGPAEIPVSLKAVQKGSEPDIHLKAEDVVYVPYSTAKNIMLGASSILSSTGGAAIYAAH